MNTFIKIQERALSLHGNTHMQKLFSTYKRLVTDKMRTVFDLIEREKETRKNIDMFLSTLRLVDNELLDNPFIVIDYDGSIIPLIDRLHTLFQDQQFETAFNRIMSCCV